MTYLIEFKSPPIWQTKNVKKKEFICITDLGQSPPDSASAPKILRCQGGSLTTGRAPLDLQGEGGVANERRNGEN